MKELYMKFYTSLLATNEVVKSNYKVRKDAAKNLHLFLNNPQEAIEFLEKSPNDDETKSIIRNLKYTLNSTWSKESGVVGLKKYLVERLNNVMETSNNVSVLFEPIDALVSASYSNYGIYYINRDKDALMAKGKEFFKVGQDNENAAKRDKIKEAIANAGFSQGLVGNNITTFFNKINSFILTLKEDYGNDDLKKMYIKYMNDSTFDFYSDDKLFTEQYEIKEDISKLHTIQTELSDTEYIIQHLEANGDPSDISVLKSGVEALYTYILWENKLLAMLADKIKRTNFMIKNAKIRYEELFEQVPSKLKLRLSDALDNADLNADALNAELSKLMFKMNTLEVNALMFSYVAHIELVEHLMHVRHVSRLRTLFETIINS